MEGRGQEQTLLSIQASLRELAVLARGERATMLAYMIEMAYLEASDILRGSQPVRDDKHIR